jgi:hypothetical protein
MTQSMEGFLLGGKIAALKFPSVGTEHTLTVTDEPELRQQTDFDSGAPLFWDDKETQPRMQLVITGEVDQAAREGVDDDGLRRLYVKGELQKAMGQALREAGAKSIEVGGKVWVKYTGDGTATGRKNPPKLYKAAYKAPEAKAAAQASFLGSSDGPGDAPPF